MKLIEDLGRQFPTPYSFQKKRYGIVECPECGERARAIIPRALKPPMCIKCYRKQKALPPINTEGLTMKLIQDLGRQYPTSTSTQKTRYALFECTLCKAHVKMAVNDVKNNKAKYCTSCMRKIVGNHNKTHGDSQAHSEYARLYRIYNHMKGRCINPKDAAYINYGGRGIKVCDEWLNSYEAFKQWALTNGYTHTLTIDRYPDSNGNYEPNNCRWATCQQQSFNQDKCRNTICSSKYKGVSTKGSTSSFTARIMINGNAKHIGSYKTELEAAQAYNNYIQEHNLEHKPNNLTGV